MTVELTSIVGEGQALGIVGGVIAGVAVTGATVDALTADTSPVTSSTAQTATGLAVTVSANATRAFSALVIYSSSTAADIELGFTHPTGATVEVLQVGATDLTAPGAGVGVEQAIALVGTIANGATAGDLALTFAQATADATDTVIHARSHLVLL